MAVITGDGRRIAVEEADVIQSGMQVHVMDVRRRRPVVLNFEALRAEIVLRGRIGPSERIERARAKGEAWAMNVSAETVTALPERQFIAFLWFYFGGLNTEEIAERMEVARQSVKNFLERARKNLEKSTARVSPN